MNIHSVNITQLYIDYTLIMHDYTYAHKLEGQVVK